MSRLAFYETYLNGGLRTPEAFAAALGMSGKTIRAHLREEFPDAAPGQGGEWELTGPMILYLTKRYL